VTFVLGVSMFYLLEEVRSYPLLGKILLVGEQLHQVTQLPEVPTLRVFAARGL
jgi:hypothetical protein